VSRPPEERLRHALRAALPPAGGGGPQRDLWPRLAQRLAEPRPRPTRLDWALLAALLVWLILFPESAGALLYHL
jgi:hypothetical protein